MNTFAIMIGTIVWTVLGTIGTVGTTAGDWIDAGNGLEGSNGPVLLAGQGALTAGSKTTLSVRNALPEALAVLQFGYLDAASSLNPVAATFVIGADGTATLTGRWPATLPPLNDLDPWAFQVTIDDPGAEFDIARSNILAAFPP